MTDTQTGDYERRRRLFLDEWHISIGSLDETIRAARQDTTNLARAVLQTATFLNGGALILVPGYITLIRDPIGPGEHSSIITLVVVFIVGLALAWLSAAGAYFTLVYQGAGMREQREAVAARLHNALNVGGLVQFPELGARRWQAGEKSAEERDAASKRNWKWAERLRWTAIGLNFVSFAAFVTGCWIGIAAVS